MSDDLDVIDAREPDEFDRRLMALFADLETKQLDFIEQAGKSIVERVAALLAVLFAVTAFGEKFPPAYLAGNTFAKICIIFTLVFYAVAMGVAMRVSQPRTYIYTRGNLDEMRATLKQMLLRKDSMLFWAGLFFFLGSIFLVVLIVAIVLRV